MATVTGLTAPRMLEIEAGSIVAAHMEGYNLVLTTHGGVDIDLGSVQGGKGDKGDVGAASNVVVGADNLLPQPIRVALAASSEITAPLDLKVDKSRIDKAFLVPESTDISTLLNSGSYMSSTWTGTTPSSGWAFVDVIRHNDRYCRQIYSRFAGTNMQWTRYQDDGVWYPWCYINTTIDIPDVKLLQNYAQAQSNGNRAHCVGLPGESYDSFWVWYNGCWNLDSMLSGTSAELSAIKDHVNGWASIEIKVGALIFDFSVSKLRYWTGAGYGAIN